MNSLPRHFHIGIQRAGSTFLYNLLKSHPEASLSTHQEVNFYTKNFDKGIEWYKNTFSGRGLPIDTSPAYFKMGDTAAPRIRKALPEGAPRFLLIIRNPIDYIYSHFHMHLKTGYFKKNPDMYPVMPDCFAEFIRRYPHYLARGRYAHILETRWLSCFDMSQFKIIFFKEFISDKRKVMSEILDFFELPQKQLATVHSSKNTMLKNPLLYHLKNRVIRNRRLKNILKKSRLFNAAYEHVLTTKPPMLEIDERNVLRDKLAEDVKKLEKISGRTPYPWKDFIQE